MRASPSFLLLLIVAISLATLGAHAAPRTAPPAGLRETSRDVHALVGAKIVISPEKTIDAGTLVLRDGVIVAVGEKIDVPADAQVWNLAGKTLYPGLIDAYGELPGGREPSGPPAPLGSIVRLERPAPEANSTGAAYWNPNVVPQTRTDVLYSADSSANKKLRSQGIATRLVAPSAGIIKGTSALVSTADSTNDAVILKDQVALHLKLTTSRGSRGYPNSPMGAYTLVRQAMLDAGWSALRALTVTPAELFSASDRLGTLEVGKAANVVVTDGPLFDKKTKVLETWVDGRRFEIKEEPLADVRGKWSLEVTRPGAAAEAYAVEISGQPEKLAGKIHRGDKSTPLISPKLADMQLTASFKGEPLGYTGVLQLSATISAPTKDGAVVDGELSWLGIVAWADGERTPFAGKRTAGPEAIEKEKQDDVKQPDDKAEPNEGDKKQDADKPEPKEPDKAIAEVNFPLGAFGRAAPPEQPAAVLFRNATIWTSGPQGKLEKADLLVTAGKISAVGAGLTAPAGATVIDLQGKHVSAGIIDCHSHAATDGGVNESGQTITAEVRIGDFVDPTDIDIYRQLAGGVTCVNILHGSANTIGGQNQVVKYRWGALPEEMKFAAAPQGIKFALGENVKQSNWGARATARYPQTRMGVEQLVRDAFAAAKQYRRQWDEWNHTKAGLPPRVDLELEALAEVVEGRRLIHCHSYRQDEILALLRTCEAFGVKIATFQHVLEGYKVADAIARHGAGGSSFSDWWAYKFEVYDAIPYNGALLHNAGVVVSFNSDNAELARRLNQEAAKAIKYGGVPPEEALKFVTLNPARQLRIDEHTGSLEPGKDADLVVWSASPLSTYSRCEQTWVDGRRYFDIEEDRQAQKNATALKARLVQRVLESGESSEKPGDGQKDNWPREDIFCEHGDHGHHHE